VRIKRVGSRPQDTEVELANPVPVLENILSGGAYPVYGGAGGGITQPLYLLWSNSDALTINTTVSTPISIQLDLSQETSAVFGLMISGEASEASVVTVKIYVDGTQMGPTIKQTCEIGWNTIGAPFVISQIPANATTLSVTLQTSAGTLNIPVNNLQLYLNSANIVGGVFTQPGTRATETIVISDILKVPSEEFTITFGEVEQ